MGPVVFLILSAASFLNPQDPPPTEEPWQPGFPAGEFTFYPSVSTQAIFDDNIFLEDEDPDSDFILLVKPGIGVTLESENLEGIFSYGVTQWWHLDKSIANRDEHAGRIGLTWAPEEFYFTFAGGYNFSAQPIDAAFANLVEVRVWTGSITAGVDLGDSRVQLETNYTHLSTPLDALEFYEYQQLTWSLKALAQLSDHVAGSAELTFGDTRYFNGDEEPVKEDNDIFEGRLGVIWIVSSEVELSAVVGFQLRDYETGNAADEFVHDYEGMVFEGTLSWAPDERNRLTLRVDRSVSESVLSNFTSEYGIHGGTSHILLPGWGLSLTGSWIRAKESTNAVVEDLKWRYAMEGVTYYALADSVTGELGLLYRGKQSVDESNEYENWRATVGLSFDF